MLVQLKNYGRCVQITTNEYSFDVINTSIQQIINKQLIEKGHTDIIHIQMRDAVENLIYYLTKENIAKRQENTLKLYTPKTWKDMFKKKHKDTWWMRRWIKKHPIQLKEYPIKITKITVFPDVEVPQGRGFSNHVVYYESIIDLPKEQKGGAK